MNPAPSSEFSKAAHRYSTEDIPHCRPETVLLGVRELRTRVLADPRPLVARATNLAAVLRVLEEAEVPHFAVKSFADLGTTLSIDVEDRERTIKALMGNLEVPANIEKLIPKPAVVREALDTSQAIVAKDFKDCRSMRLWWNLISSDQSLVFAKTYGVQIEFWHRDEWREGLHGQVGFSKEEIRARYIGPRPNRLGRIVDLSTASFCLTDTADLGRFEQMPGSSGIQVRALGETTEKLPDEVTFPIDVVYTWVDGDDPQWQKKRARHSGTVMHQEASSSARFLSRNELLYSLRSLYANAPWVRNVYIVSDEQVPRWLNDSHPAIQIVCHSDIFTDTSSLPVFNSHAIESQIHHLDGLSEHFVYLNDDMFIGRPVTPQHLFTPSGIMKLFPSPSRVMFGPIKDSDSPVDSATKNVREALRRDFNITVTQVMEHAPYTARRSVLYEMEEKYSELFDVTRAARFRSSTDVNTLSNFVQHYALLTGRAVSSSMSFTYIGLAVSDLQFRLDRLLKARDRTAFCLNDTFSEKEELEAQNEIVGDFLESYFPVAGPWESR